MHKVIIIGSAGSPNEIIDILNLKENLNIPIIICIHFFKNAVESYAEHIKRSTKHDVIIVEKDEKINNGIFIAEGGKDIIFKNKTTITSTTNNSTKVHPSIEHLLSSILKIKDNEISIFVLSGLGNDGAKYARKLEDIGVKFFIEKNPKFEYLPKSFSENLKNSEYLTIEQMKEKIKFINSKRRWDFGR